MQGSCNEDIGFPGLFIDGSHVAAGIKITSVMGTTVGPQTYLLNFSEYGIQVNGGHEVMILETWLGETNFDYNFSAPGAIAPTATAIQINSNDHYILNSIVFSSKVGLHNAGAANAVTGLHVWFPFNVAEKHGATAFLDTGHQNRYTGCYIDCSHTWFVNPSATVWTGGFALGGAGVIIDGNVTNFRLTNTVFEGGSVRQLDSSFTPTVVDSYIAGNLQGGSRPVPGTIATLRQTSQTPLATWTFDFCASLAFPNVPAIVTNLAFNTPGSSIAFPVAVARQHAEWQCGNVTIDVMPATVGTLVVTVDSSSYTF